MMGILTRKKLLKLIQQSCESVSICFEEITLVGFLTCFEVFTVDSTLKEGGIMAFSRLNGACFEELVFNKY